MNRYRSSRWSALVAALVVAVVGIPFVCTNGCSSSSDSGGDGLEPAALDAAQFRKLATSALTGEPPPGAEAAKVAIEVVMGDSELIPLEDVTASPGIANLADAHTSVVIAGPTHGIVLDSTNWAVALPDSVTGSVAVSGALSNTQTAADGAVVALTLTVGITGGDGQVGLQGTVTQSGVVYNIDIDSTIDTNGLQATVTTDGSISAGTTKIYQAKTTRLVDHSTGTRTLTGSIQAWGPTAPSRWVKATFNSLSVRITPTSVTYLSGTVTLQNESGFTCTLVRESEGVLVGEITAPGGTKLADVRVENGQITITVVG